MPLGTSCRNVAESIVDDAEVVIESPVDDAEFDGETRSQSIGERVIVDDAEVVSETRLLKGC
jgi:hypothetical protein